MSKTKEQIYAEHNATANYEGGVATTLPPTDPKLGCQCRDCQAVVNPAPVSA